MTTPPIDWLGPTPWETVARAFDEQCPAGYPMQLVGEDADAATAAVNQGIDSRLEAVTFTEKPGWKDTHKLGFPKLHLSFDLPGLLVFLRRLYEIGESASDLGDHASSLRNGILYSLDIDED